MIEQVWGWIRWVVGTGGASQRHIDYYFKTVLIELSRALLKRRYSNEAVVVPHVMGVRNASTLVFAGVPIPLTPCI
jgi:hypothetical protein